MKTIADGISIVARIAYLEGQIKGITDYAIWRNGDQLVGCLERPLKEVIAPLLEEIKSLKAEVEEPTAEPPPPVAVKWPPVQN